ncbi:hypothetical protein EMCRGX_G024742 [Ephydatia muelleri]
MEGECEEFDQKLLLKQLDSLNLLRLWRTGASELLYNTEEDEYSDVRKVEESRDTEVQSHCEGHVLYTSTDELPLKRKRKRV